MTTIKQAQEQCRDLGLVLSKCDGEYRVNFKGGDERSAYYTTDIDDAVGTARAMAEQRNRVEQCKSISADPRIGILMRNGKHVFYAFHGEQMIERDSLAAIQSSLRVLDAARSF